MAVGWDQLLELSRLALAVTLTAANVAVWRGVYLESDKFSKETRDRGWKLLLYGLAAEAAAGFLLFSVDTTISFRQEKQIASLNNDTARLSFETETARKEAAEAKLQLEQLRKQMGPRWISSVALKADLAGVPTKKTEIVFVRDVPDALTLSMELFMGLSEAGWLPQKQPQPIQPPPADSYLSMETLAAAAGGLSSGVSVVARDLEDPSVKALMNAVGKQLGMSGGKTDEKLPADTIKIVIGPKP